MGKRWAGKGMNKKKTRCKKGGNGKSRPGSDDAGISTIKKEGRKERKNKKLTFLSMIFAFLDQRSDLRGDVVLERKSGKEKVEGENDGNKSVHTGVGDWEKYWILFGNTPKNS